MVEGGGSGTYPPIQITTIQNNTTTRTFATPCCGDCASPAASVASCAGASLRLRERVARSCRRWASCCCACSAGSWLSTPATDLGEPAASSDALEAPRAWQRRETKLGRPDASSRSCARRASCSLLLPLGAGGALLRTPVDSTRHLRRKTRASSPYDPTSCCWGGRVWCREGSVRDF